MGAWSCAYPWRIIILYIREMVYNSTDMSEFLLIFVYDWVQK